MNADFSKTAVLKTIKEYTLISIGLVMYSFAWTGILIPADVMGGGINGVGLLIYYATGGTNGGVPLGLSFLVLAAIFGYVMVAVNGYTIDAVMAGNRQSTQVLIVSKKYEEIARLIFSEMRRGVTLLDGEGWYTKQPTKVVMVVCRKYETGTLFKLIKRVDPEAFMTVGNVMGVYGHGFEALKK